MKYCAKATSSPLARSLSPRWRPKPRHLEIVGCHLPGSFSPRIPRFLKSVLQDSGFFPRDSVGGVPRSGESPPTLSFPRGNPRPPSLSLREGSSRPSSPPERGESPPTLVEPQLCAAEKPARSALPATERAGPGRQTRRGGCCGDQPGRGRRDCSSGACERTAALQLQAGAAAAAARGPAGRRLGSDARGAPGASAEPRAGEATFPLRSGLGAPDELEVWGGTQRPRAPGKV